MEKIEEVSWKLGKIGQNVNETLTPKPKHDRMWAWEILNIPLENILMYSLNVLKWNLEVEPFVARWIVQTKEHKCKLKAIGDHMLPWDVVRKGRCYYWLVLRLQERRDVDQS